MRRRALLGGAALLPQAARAQSWPERPLRLVQGFGPDSTSAGLARLLAPELGAALGQPVQVESRIGVGGSLAAETVARAQPDGQVMLLLNNGYATAAALLRRLPYDAEQDIVPATVLASMPLVLLVAPGSPFSNLPQFLEAARARPGAMQLATAGTGSTQHFVAEALQAQTGARLTHRAYPSTATALAALRQGAVQAVMESVVAVLGQVRGGEARALAVTTAHRFAGLPLVPTAQEQGVAEFDQPSWFALGFPAGTPEGILWRLQAETSRAFGKENIRRQMASLGLTPIGSTPPEARRLVLNEIERARALVTAAGIPQQ